MEEEGEIKASASEGGEKRRTAMRVNQFKTFADVIRSDPATLAREYHNLTTQDEHEFSSDTDRDAYAAVIHALGMFQHRSSFPTELQELAGERFKPLPTEMTCKQCGGNDIVTDASATWDPAAGAYVLAGVFDDDTCQTCENNGSAIADLVPVAPERGTRVRIRKAARADGDPFAERTGSVERPNYVRGGVYVRLDRLPHERVDRIELVELKALEIAARVPTS